MQLLHSRKHPADLLAGYEFQNFISENFDSHFRLTSAVYGLVSQIFIEFLANFLLNFVSKEGIITSK